MRFQGGTRTGKGRGAEQPFERHAAGAEFAQHEHGRPLGPNSIFLSPDVE